MTSCYSGPFQCLIRFTVMLRMLDCMILLHFKEVDFWEFILPADWCARAQAWACAIINVVAAESLDVLIYWLYGVRGGSTKPPE